jgi:hypothetical protein
MGYGGTILIPRSPHGEPVKLFYTYFFAYVTIISYYIITIVQIGGWARGQQLLAVRK